MRLSLRRLLPLIGCTTLVTTVQAQNNDCLKDLKWPGVGKWAEYTMVSDNKTSKIRYAVIGTEKREGVDMRWIEMKMTGENKDKDLTYQMLLAGQPHEVGKAYEVIFKPGDKQAMKMSGMMMKMIRGQMEKNSVLSNLCEGVTLVGEESVTVPAGTFKAMHFHSAKHESDSWASPSVPFVMVKSEGKKFKMELAATGDGAKSSITETPTEMPGLGGPNN
jgi:hypothetical protein